MKTFKVSWKSVGIQGASTYIGKNQADVLMKVMKRLSPDGIHAPRCTIKVEPIAD